MDPVRDVKTCILTEATRLFARQGFGATSVREVVAAAGVTKPALYYYFSSKEALYLEVVGTQVRLLERVVSESLRGAGAPLERVAAFVDGYVNAGLASPDGVRVMMTAHHPGHEGPDLADVLTTYEETIRTLLTVLGEAQAERSIAARVDLRAATLGLLGACNLYIHAALDGFPLPEQPARALVDLFLHGVVDR